VWCQFSII